MKELIKKMKYADTWHKNDISIILAKYNSDIGGEINFGDLVFRAQKAGILAPIDPPKSGGAFTLTLAELKVFN